MENFAQSINLSEIWATTQTGIEYYAASFSAWIQTLLSGEVAPHNWIIPIAAAALIGLTLRFLVRKARPAVVDLRSATRSARRLGYLTAMLFFGVLGIWAYQAPLSSAALAPGVVSPDGSRKTVQHLEGGIIRSIHIQEGDFVAAGTPLLTLENLQALARYEEMIERLYFLTATEARIVAEIADEAEIRFPEALRTTETKRAARVMASQRQLFENRRSTQTARERILAVRMQQLEEEIGGQLGVIEAEEANAELVEMELNAAQELHEKALIRLSQLLDLKKQLVRSRAAIASGKAEVARLNQQIGETELQLIATRQQAREQGSIELAEVRAEIAAQRTLLPERKDALARTVVRAPIDGRVMNVQVTTEQGGVLKAGGAILDIVPEDGGLVIDARVNPIDIESVRPGLDAQVVLTAYSQRNLPQLIGELQSVSADRLVDDRTGEPYFLAKVTVHPEDVERLGENIHLLSGMSADVMILTGEQTLFEFLFKPFADSLNRSLRES